MEATHATHAVVDLRDGYTWVKDGSGQLMDYARAQDMADRYNDGMKPGHTRYSR